MGSNTARRWRALAAAVLGLATLGVGASPAAAATIETRVSAQGATVGQTDPNTLMSLNDKASWQPAFAASLPGPHFFDQFGNDVAQVPSTANWINCQASLSNSCGTNVWYRTFIVMPNDPALSLQIRILADDFGTVYLNGQLAVSRFQTQRFATINSALLVPGTNVVDILVEDTQPAQSGTRWELKGTFDESAGPDPDGNGVPDPDGDGDGTPDATDNCPSTANFDQANVDGDGQGDACDPDDDNDGVPDVSDAFPKNASESVDTDGDGVGNNADTDDDNDGVPDGDDVFPLDPTESFDNDGDGIGDRADLDDDNDGVGDKKDRFPLDPSESADADGDGTGDNADTDDDNDGVNDTDDAFPLDATETTDTDGDGIGNNADADDDNDGLADVDEGPTGTSSLDPDTDDDGVLDGADTLPTNPTVGSEAANAAGICSVIERFATKHGAAVSLCNHLEKAQRELVRGNQRGFEQAMSVFDKELTAQTNGRNAAISAANAATIRAMVARWVS